MPRDLSSSASAKKRRICSEVKSASLSLSESETARCVNMPVTRRLGRAYMPATASAWLQSSPRRCIPVSTLTWTSTLPRAAPLSSRAYAASAAHWVR